MGGGWSQSGEKTNCCAPSVPHRGSFEAFSQAATAWQERLSAGLSRSIQASDHTLGHWAGEILHRTHELERALLAEAAQQKADQAPHLYPVLRRKAKSPDPGP